MIRELTADQFAALPRDLDGAPHGIRWRVIEAHAAASGMSAATLSREIARRRGRHRQRRSDADKFPEDDKAAFQEILACILHHSPDAPTRWYSTDMAIAKCEREQRIPVGMMSVSKFNRIERILNGRQLKNASTRFEAQRSNELHQVDSSGSEYLRFVERDGDDCILEISKCRGGAWKNKSTGERKGVWLTNVLDDHSRVLSGRYSVYPGESATMVIETLKEVWGGFDSLLALHGLPERVYADHGPFQNSKEGKAFMKNLGVEFLGATPGNSRARGKVENRFRTVWRNFEMDLLGREGERIKLSELNELYVHFLVTMQARSHPRLPDQTCLDMYLADLGEIRTLPPDAGLAAFHTEWRTVRQDRGVWYRGDLYEAPPAYVDKRIKILHAGERILGQAADGQTFDLEIQEPHALDDFHAAPETLAQKLVKRTAGERYGSSYDDRPAQTHVIARPAAEVENASPIAQHDRAANFASPDEARAVMAPMIGCAIEDLSEDAQWIIASEIKATRDRRHLMRLAADLCAKRGMAQERFQPRIVS